MISDFPQSNLDEPGFGRTGFGRYGICPDKGFGFLASHANNEAGWGWEKKIADAAGESYKWVYNDI